MLPEGDGAGRAAGRHRSRRRAARNEATSRTSPSTCARSRLRLGRRDRRGVRCRPTRPADRRTLRQLRDGYARRPQHDSREWNGSKKKRPRRAGRRCRRANPYVQRVIEDEELRDNIAQCVRERHEGAYGRLTNGKAGDARSLDDKKLQKELKKAAESLRDAGAGAARGAQEEEARAAASASSLLVGIVGAGRRARAQRGPAQQGARRAVRRRGGVRLHLDHLARAVHGAASRRPRTRAAAATATCERAPRGAPFVSPALAALASRLAGQLGWRRWRPRRAASARDRGREGPAHRRGDALERRPARRRGLDVRPRRARGAASRAGCCTTTSAPRSGCSPRSCAATASCAWPRSTSSSRRRRDADDVIDVLVASLRATSSSDEPEFVTVVFELFTLVAAQRGDRRRVRRAAAPHARARRRRCWRAKQAEGVAAPARRARGGGRRALLAGRRPRAAHAHRARPRLRRRRSTRASLAVRALLD